MARTLTRSYHRIATTKVTQALKHQQGGAVSSSSSTSSNVLQHGEFQPFHHPLPLRIIMGQRIPKKLQQQKDKVHRKKVASSFSDDSTVTIDDATTVRSHAIFDRSMRMEDDEGMMSEPEEKGTEEPFVSYKQQVEEDLKRAREIYDSQFRHSQQQ